MMMMIIMMMVMMVVVVVMMILPCDIYDTPREICSNTILGTKDIVDLY
jgi:hypothetical protein